MKNLKIYRSERRTCSVVDESPILITTRLDVTYVFYVNNDLGYLGWFSTGDKAAEEQLSLIDRNDDRLIIVIPELAYVDDSLLLPLADCNVVLRIESFFDNNDHPIVSRETVELPTADNYDGDLKIVRLWWNYARDRVIISTSDPRIVFTATSYFDVLYAIDLSIEQTITRPNVGWGQKATQFKGYRKKTITDEKLNNDNANNNDDDGNVYVAWRKDGAMFAINYRTNNNNTNRRRIKVFTGEGVLKFVSEDDNGTLASPITWKPSFGLIGAVQLIADDTEQICLLEQNALYRCSFELPRFYRVTRLSWNFNSDLLAVCSYKSDTSDDDDDNHNEIEKAKNYVIFLWVSSNCEWYLKRCLYFNETVSNMTWDSREPYKLHVVCSSEYRNYEWNLKYDVSYRCYCERYTSLIVSINGSSCEVMTPMKAIIPPPLSAHKIRLPDYADEIVFPENSCYATRNCLPSFALVCRNLLYTFSYNDGEFANTFKYRLNLNDLLTSHWRWCRTSLIFFQYVDRTGAIFFCKIRTPSAVNNTDEFIDLPIVEKIPLTASISAMTDCSSKDEAGLLIGLTDGSLFVYYDDRRDNVIVERSSSSSSYTYWKMELTEFGLIGLLSDGDDRLLLVDRTVIDSKVTEFVWSSPYLLYTTEDFILICCHLDRTITVNVRLTDRRHLERTDRLVSLIGCTLILQHSRGNLETIIPRPFVLSYLHRLLNRRRYTEAFYFARNLRLGYNMLVDANPSAFLNDIDRFVRVVNGPTSSGSDLLKAFVDDLQPKSYALTVFNDYYRHYPIVEPTDKFVSILNALVNSISDNLPDDSTDEASSRIILTCLTRLDRLEEALKFAKNRNSLSFLLKLTNGRNLFQAALAGFDLDSALIVAKMAQLEAEDYRLTLDRLKNMTEHMRKFTILEMAGNHTEALRYVLLVDDPSEADYRDFIRRHNLYSNALQLSIGTDKYETIRLMYADYLSGTKKSYEEAALIYDNAGEYGKAFDAFLAAEKWDECLALANRQSVSFDRAVRTIVESCRTRGNRLKAAELTRHYLNDSDACVELYLEAEHFEEALNVALFDCRRLTGADIAERFRPSLTTAYSRLWKSIAKSIDTIVGHATRLKIIKEDRAAFKKRTECELELNSTEDELFSREPSIVGSSVSTATCSSKKKLERRLWNLKEGNPREELALYKSLRSNLEELYRSTDQVRSICSVTVRLGDIDRASKLQTHFKNAVTTADQIKSIVWNCSTIDNTRKYEDILVRCLPIHLPKASWEISFLNR